MAFGVTIGGMPLPVLPSTFSQSSADLIRLFHQSQLEWSRHLGEETQLDFGRWISNPALPDSREANCLHDAFLLPGLSAAQLIADQAALPWRGCSLSPSMPTTGLADALVQAGWKPEPLKIFYRKKNVEPVSKSDLKLTIIPARASYRHYRELLQCAEDKKGVEYLFHQPLYSQADKRYQTPFLSVASAWVEAQLQHLDDPHLDSLLALRGAEAVGCVGVLTSGEFGTLRDWYVAEAHRGQGIGRVLLDRALEICTRGLLKHVMIGLPPEAAEAMRLIQQAGFVEIGIWNAYTR